MLVRLVWPGWADQEIGHLIILPYGGTELFLDITYEERRPFEAARYFLLRHSAQIRFHDNIVKKMISEHLHIYAQRVDLRRGPQPVQSVGYRCQ